MEWVNSYVIVEKEVKLDSGDTHSPNHTISKKLRLCLDPRNLNNALQWEPYYSRSVDELTGKFHKTLFLSILDMKKDYWMVKLHPDSKPLTCMTLEHGRFQWTCLPMGTVVAWDVFQRKQDEFYEGLPGITGIAEDIVIYGQNKEQQDRNFLCFLEVTRKACLWLNAVKLQFQLTEVSFFGHHWTSHGISPNPKKIKAITSMKFPVDKETMQSFLGMINFLNRYSPKLADLTDPLCQLCRLHAVFHPTKETKEAFHQIQQKLSKNIQLPYFDSNSDTGGPY